MMLGVDASALTVYEADVQLAIGRGTLQGLMRSCYGSAPNSRARPMLFCEVQELLCKRCEPA